MITILQILFGISVLLFGRKLFWLFVGAIGFITATEVAAAQMSALPDWVIILVGIGVGLIGALLAVFFQIGAIAFAGFLGGGYLGSLVVQYLGISTQAAQAIAFFIGAVIGLFLFLALFDIGLVAFSAIIGGLVIVEAIDLKGLPYWVLAAIIALIGISVQVNQQQSVETTA